MKLARDLLGRVSDNLWLLTRCRDLDTFWAMKRRENRAAASAGLPELQLRGLRQPFVYRPHSTDIPVVWEVLRGRQYDTTGCWPFRTIVDCGANIGAFFVFAQAKAGARLDRYVGVEPDLEAFGVLERQVEASLVRDRCVLLNAAVWSADGTVRFDGSGPSSARRVSEAGTRTVAALTVERILESAGMMECDLLKLDIEGAEVQVLAEISSWGPKVKAVVCELHAGADESWFAATVSRAGFRPFPAGGLFRGHPGAVRPGAARAWGW